jgi:hypothetical protein
MRKYGRRDDNHKDIVGTFRACGASVMDCADLGDGKPDLIVAINSLITFAVEVKDGSKPPSKRKLTEKEIEFRDSWKGRYVIIESVDDVIQLMRNM